MRLCRQSSDLLKFLWKHWALLVPSAGAGLAHIPESMHESKAGGGGGGGCLHHIFHPGLQCHSRQTAPPGRARSAADQRPTMQIQVHQFLTVWL